MDMNNSFPMANKNINFTAIVVTYNEDRRLKHCLRSLHFCNQVIVVDLGSTDSSVAIAKELGAEVLHVKRMPVVEQIHAKVINYSKNDWVILLDPDEVMPDGVESSLREKISMSPNLGRIYIPWQFYFKGTPLSCTIWGNKNATKLVVLHKSRNNFTSQVHSGTQLLESFIDVTLLRRGNNYIKHFWMDSYRQLFEKHWRYIGEEGKAKFARGERFSVRKLLIDTTNAFKHNFISYNGFRSFNGIFLSFFYTWYVFMSLLSLRKYQKAVQAEPGTSLTTPSSSKK